MEDTFNSQNYIEQLESEVRQQQGQIGTMAQASSFQNTGDNNLIVWQLEVDNVLERIEHLLRGDIVSLDQDGNQVYVEPEDKSLITLNDYGVKLIMNTISFYLNRNTILSNYDSKRIYEILYDLGIELSDVIYINYEKMGMDSIEKRSRYPIIVLNILHTVESTYNRALKGGERESLRTARIVTQNEPMNRGGGNQMSSGKRFKLMNPRTWV